MVQATGGLNLYAGGAGFDAHIGNGVMGGSQQQDSSGLDGDVTGDIWLKIGGTTLFEAPDTGQSGMAWLGNVAPDGSIESGNVTLITGEVSSLGSESLGTMMLADLGTTASAGSGGDFTLALTAARTDFINSYFESAAIEYSSPHALTLLSTRTSPCPIRSRTTGRGALTILAGWNSAVAPADVLTTPGAFGQNGAFLWVVGNTGYLQDYNPQSSGTQYVDSGAGAAIGSKGGTVTIGAAQIYIEGLTGYAQIGYHGSGGSGDIDVIANGLPGTGG